MADDIGPGDVVEYIDRPCTIPTGTRDIVLRTVQMARPCNWCGVGGTGLELLRSRPQPRDKFWCLNHWRKIGGSREDTIRRFAEDLTAKPPARVLEPAGADARVEGRK